MSADVILFALYPALDWIPDHDVIERNAQETAFLFPIASI